MPESSPEVAAAELAEKVDAADLDTDVKDTSTESSPAGIEGEKADMLAAVKAALSAEETPPSSTNQGPQSKEGAEKAPEGDVSEPDKDELTKEELDRLRPKTRKRIENLVNERRQRDGQIAELDSKLGALEPKAQRFDQMVQFIEKANLSTEEVNEGFEVMRLLKNDPLKAWERLQPIFAQLQQMVGQVLPDDLQTAVSQGEITEAHARELVKARTRALVSENDTRRRDAQVQEEQQTRRYQEQQTAVHTAVADWEKSKVGKDPDWKLKQPRVMEIVRLETLEREKRDPGFAWTPEEALKFANSALERVNDEFRRFSPRPKAMDPITDVASSRSNAQPKTALEAAKLALAQMAG